MKQCDINHPYHFGQADRNGVRPSWGGHIGDLALHQEAPFFGGVMIHRRPSSVTAEIDGRYIRLFDHGFCCAHHQKMAELLAVARLPEAKQTFSFPAMRDSSGRIDPMARAFSLSRKLAGKLN